ADLPIESANPAGVFGSPMFVKAVGHDERLAVLGDRDVTESCSACCFRHRLYRIFAVRFHGVHMQVAEEIAAIDQARKSPARRRFDFTLPFSQLWRDPGKAERFVYVLLMESGDAYIIGVPKQSVFVQLESKADRPITEGDGVRLRACEVLKRGASTVGGHDSQVGLKATGKQHARLGCSPSEYSFDQPIAGELVH